MLQTDDTIFVLPYFAISSTEAIAIYRNPAEVVVQLRNSDGEFTKEYGIATALRFVQVHDLINSIRTRTSCEIYRNKENFFATNFDASTTNILHAEGIYGYFQGRPCGGWATVHCTDIQLKIIVRALVMAMEK